jgi:endonuclease G
LQAIARIEAGDPALASELRALRAPDGARALPRSPNAELETIVLKVGRPVLSIVGSRAQLEFRESASEVWRGRLEAAADRLEAAIRAVGRINVAGHPELQWVGTGWLADETTVVTNRHVAREFGRRANGRFTFTTPGRTAIRPSIDFLGELDRADRLEFRVVEILHIEDDDGPDVALLRVEPADGGPALSSPIPLAAAPVRPGTHIAVIGYPARDSRIADFSLMQSIFGDVYDHKRLAPGQVLESRPHLVTHDCSTLGGNSGSVVVDLTDGRAVALHFAGRFLKANSAVPAAIVAERLAALKHPGHGAPPSRPPAPEARPDPGPDPDEVFVEAKPADYLGRRGYDPEFIGVTVPMPTVVKGEDVLGFPSGPAVEQELKYEHFSVLMSRSRRLCLVSAANLDGGQLRRVRRAEWRVDPRIGEREQIRNDCYGNAPRFSRGHMTRRTDPVWGTPEEASRANADSMHVTNTVPQLQPFNAGVWLGLEDYALDHAAEDDMRISVFTGPVLAADDPVRYGVAIPRSFWKVIAFVHDRTRRLSATGYILSQEELLGEQEFVFGRHKTWQTSLRAIETRTGLRFGPLTDADPYVEEAAGGATPLTDFGQIVFDRA